MVVSNKLLVSTAVWVPAEPLLKSALLPTPLAAKLVLAAKLPLAKVLSPNCTKPELLLVTWALVVVSYTLLLTVPLVVSQTLALLMVALALLGADTTL